METSRRQFTSGAIGFALASVAMPPFVKAQAQGRVVVIGGGAGGATAAKYIAKSADGAIDVTLVQDTPQYTTCFYSNLYLGGMRSFSSITHGYEALAERYGINVLINRAIDVDSIKKQVVLRDGKTVPYDILVVAPGIDFDYKGIEGYSEGVSKDMPHAWKAGEQTKILKAQLEAMEDGGLFVMSVPPDPYRCPPGPYERACLIAHYFDHAKPKSKILILDAKDKHSKQALFRDAWDQHYPGMIEWVPGEFGGKVDRVNAAARTVSTDGENHHADVANIIPPQHAAEIARRAGLVDETGWCPILPDSMKSAKVNNIYVIGDACIPGDMPKSAFSANSQAKVAAMRIRHELTGSRKFPPLYRNTCYSTLSPDDVVKVGATYIASEQKIEEKEGFISAVGEGAHLRLQTKKEADGWYDGITHDIFG